MEYRREIDGLRALAVVSVILYHAGFNTFKGGFVGVDVFFVISGYLITSIIISEKQNNTFSIVNFYERRARRILPALFVVMMACIVMSWIYLLPSDMKPFGQGITASAAFVSNIYFYEKNNDYFGLQSDQNPILHLWSLSVEEQYYLIFPILLILLWRFGKNWVVSTLVVLSFISLAAAQLGSASNPAATFFLLPTRGWELFIGSFIAFFAKELHHINSNQKINQILSLSGFVLILFSIFFFDKQTPFPSLWALIPTIGTALIIVFTTENTFSSKLFGSKIMVGIGLISFSAYLWHQPLFAFNRILNYTEPSSLSFLFYSILALLLAYLTWRFIEKPFRSKNFVGRSTIFSFALIGSCAFIIFGVLGHFNNGYPDRDPLYKRLASNFGMSLACNGNYSINSTCSTSSTPELAFLGNSYAMHLVDGFRSIYPNKNIVQLTQDSCSPYTKDQKAGLGKLECSEFYSRAIATIINSSSIKTIVISSPFGDLMNNNNMDRFEDTIKRLKAANKRVIIVGPTPSNGTDFGKCFIHNRSLDDISKCNFKRQSINNNYFNIITGLKSLSDKDNIEFIDLTNLICDMTICKASDDGVMIFRDSGHLSIEGSKYIFQHLNLFGPLNDHGAL